MPAWVQIQQWLQDELARLSATNSAFANSQQVESVIELIWLNVLPAYLDFHRDLLFHQEPEGLFNGFFLGRVMEAVLEQGGPWNESERIVSGTIARLNDFVGYRPVAVLEGRRLEPYANEWVRPIPLYIAGVGTCDGPYRKVIDLCMQILAETDKDIIRRAGFDLKMMSELAIDPRAYDFDHPVNQRPNYHFGQWDPHCIDNSGFYRRFVIQHVTLNALLARIEQEPELPREELVFEAAAVLAGTMLMASGISGNGPGAFSSEVTLTSMLGPIAQYRDDFYEHLMSKLASPHLDRLQAEKEIRRQPLGGARQHLNTFLAKHRACQLEHVHLARLFARMGNSIAAKEQSDFVSVPSARIMSRIDCLLTAADHFLQVGKLDEAAEISPQIMDLIQRGIQCGALVDPWNILGFAGNFARFEGPDSAVHDHRVDDLVQLMELVFALQSRIWREGAAAGRKDVCFVIEKQLREGTKWWHQFAAHEVADVGATDPRETLQSAVIVAKALELWHSGGAGAGDVRFWAPHADLFDSPKAYALVVESLLERDDFVAAMALLVHWLGQADRVGLQSGETSFSDLARRWMQRHETRLQLAQGEDTSDPNSGGDQRFRDWSVAQKFFDYLEANAGDFWLPPKFQLAVNKRRNKADENDPFEIAGGDDLDSDETENLFEAAYEGVVFNDSTDDGVDSSLSEEGDFNSTELADEANRLHQRLNFLTAIAQMWKGAALSLHLRRELAEDSPVRPTRLHAMEAWASQAATNRAGLLRLMKDVSQFVIAGGAATHDAMSRYDRQRLIKESLLERIIAAAVETADARRLLLATLSASGNVSDSVATELERLPEDDKLAICIVGKLLHGNHADVPEAFTRLLLVLRTKKLLYIPLARGGDPAQIYSVRLRRRVLSHLLVWLPRQGMFYQACQLIETARFMEHHNPIGPGAVTEFDDLFHLCFVSMARATVQNSLQWRYQELKGMAAGSKTKGNKPKADSKSLTKAGTKRFELTPEQAQAAIKRFDNLNVDLHDGESLAELEPSSDELIVALEQITEVMLGSWLSHSRTLRLSILETVDNSRNWQQLVEFIQRYGGPIFTQSFLRLGNVRAILHQGVGRWLRRVMEEGFHEDEFDDLTTGIREGQISQQHAERMLSVVLEAIIDHYAEYRDYNSTTTQSDRGELLYMFLDFLRLRVQYDRVSWNLKPIYWTHEVLVRMGCQQTAQQWRRALAERIGRESDVYVERLVSLQTKYAMRMPTVADRLHERFTRPMTVDRMRSLVGPSIRSFWQTGKTATVFELLLEECKLMMEQPTGVGLDVPQWLSALEEEVETVLDNQRGYSNRARYDYAVAFRPIDSNEIIEQLTAAATTIKSLNLTSGE
ncbi:MAG: hypothetical protein KDB03_09880, partial [Planctomycetales bacterium]|nr:hypothetical protein [Planctomycetales bacterium]